MPTYRNVSNLPYRESGVEINAFSSLETYKILTESSTLIKTSNEPYYNLYIENNILTFTGTQTKTVDITDISNSNSALIWNILGCNVTVYLNSLSNVPSIGPISAGKSFEIFLKKSISSIICVSSGSGSCQILIKKRGELN